MKRISSYQPTRTFWLVAAMLVLPRLYLDLDIGSLWHALPQLLMGLTILFVLGWCIHFLLGTVVLDNGASLVVRRRRTWTTIPFTDIERVTYEDSRFCKKVRLEFAKLTPVGERLTFQVAPLRVSAPHHPIADDLHRRSLCCRSDDGEPAATLA